MNFIFFFKNLDRVFVDKINVDKRRTDNGDRIIAAMVGKHWFECKDAKVALYLQTSLCIVAILQAKSLYTYAS